MMYFKNNDGSFSPIAPRINDAAPSDKTTYSGNKVEEIASNLADNTAIASTTTGVNPTITDSGDGYVQDLTVYGRSDVSKNKAPITLNYIKNNNAGTWSGNTVTINGIDYTINVDENDLVTSISFNGTASSTSLLQLCDIQSYNDAYIFNGVNNGSVETYRIDARNENAGVITTFTNGEINTNFQEAVRFVIRIQAGYVASNVVLKPMLRLATETDPTFAPYFSGIHGIGEDGLEIVTTSIELYSIGGVKDELNENQSAIIKRCDGVYLSDLTWVYESNNGRFRTNSLATVINPISADALSCNEYLPDSAMSGADKTIFVYPQNKSIYLYDSRYTDVNTFVNAVTDVKLAYILAESYEIPLTSDNYTSATVTTGIPLYSVGDVKDELDEKRGVVVKRCEKVVLDGSENWSEYAQSAIDAYGNHSFMLLFSDASKARGYASSQLPNQLCNILTIASQDTIYSGTVNTIGLVGASGNQNFVQIRQQSCSTVADLKTYLASNPVTVVYELAEPVEIPLTAAEISALRNLRTYNPTTNVTVTDDPTVEVEYLLNTNNGQAVADVQNKMKTELEEKSFITTATLLANSWVGAAAPYSQTVNVTGVNSTDTPIVDVIVSDTVSTGLDEIKAFSNISKATASNGTITFMCYEEAPTVDLTLNIKVVR